MDETELKQIYDRITQNMESENQYQIDLIKVIACAVSQAATIAELRRDLSNMAVKMADGNSLNFKIAELQRQLDQMRIERDYRPRVDQFEQQAETIRKQTARIERIIQAGYVLRDTITDWGAKSAGQTLPIELAEACDNFMMVAALRDDNG